MTLEESCQDRITSGPDEEADLDMDGKKDFKQTIDVDKDGRVDIVKYGIEDPENPENIIWYTVIQDFYSEEVTVEAEIEEAEKEDAAKEIKDDESVESSPLSKGIKKVTDVVKNLGWKSIVIILVSLSIVGGAVWYFLRDKRKRFVEIKAKEK